MSRGRLVASLTIQECSVQQIFFELSCIFAVLVFFLCQYFGYFFVAKRVLQLYQYNLAIAISSPGRFGCRLFFLAIAITIDVILQDIANVFQIMLNVS